MANNAGPFSFQSLPASNLSVRSITTTASMTASDQIIYASTAGGDYTLTLVNPATLPTGTVLYVVKTTSDLNVLTISSISTTLNTNGESVMLVVNGSGAWTIAQRYIPDTAVSYTPTGSWSTNTTYTGYYWRSGVFLESIVKIDLAGAPTSASLTLTLPGGLSVDTTTLLPTTAGSVVAGSQAILRDTGTARFSGYCTYGNTATAVQVMYYATGVVGATDAAVTQAAPYTFANTDQITIYYRVPISGWKG